MTAKALKGLVGAPVGAVVDLRAYAAGTTPADDWIGGRAVPAFTDAAATVAALAPRGEGRVDGLLADEFVLALDGGLEIDSDGDRLSLRAGMSAVLPVGTSFTWRAAEGTLLVIASCPAAQPGTAETPVTIDQAAPLSPSNPPLAELLVGPTPSCRNHSDYWSASREFVCGTWDSTPYHRRQMPYRHIELMHLLEGSVTFADAGGSVTFSAGDVCLVIRGDGCAWISETHVKKVYATQRPA
ncbi:cupin domain-containing protein [Nitrospirillum iridis]|uniref:Putative cupin superfamily protein n=1 Tax=Nitrospirillum iridis TaxID=765888 RepID=A0A7X0EHX2_9PROT|nr:cupin domain-containing protein [Nitrospirillum iridis]MBB6255134.1 putative cupin superfamily protein [Nitrospirillum iridis]